MDLLSCIHMGVSSGAGTAYSFRAPEFTHYLVFCVIFCPPLCVCLSFSFDHCYALSAFFNYGL